MKLLLNTGLEEAALSEDYEHRSRNSLRMPSCEILVAGLAAASLHGHAGVVQQLLTAGTDPKVGQCEISCSNCNALAWAGHPEIMKILHAQLGIAADASGNETSDPVTEAYDGTAGSLGPQTWTTSIIPNEIRAANTVRCLNTAVLSRNHRALRGLLAARASARDWRQNFPGVLESLLYFAIAVEFSSAGTLKENMPRFGVECLRTIDVLIEYLVNVNCRSLRGDYTNYDFEITTSFSDLGTYSVTMQFITRARDRGYMIDRLPLTSTIIFHNLVCWQSYQLFYDIFFTLLKAGADVNANKGEALREACALGDKEIVNLLLEVGADVNAYISPKDCFSGRDELHEPRTVWSPLLAAVMHAEWEVLKILLDAHVAVNASVPGVQSTALHYSCATKKDSCTKVQMLLEAGINLWPRDESGMTSLEVAQLHGNHEAAQLLREAAR